MTKLSVCMIVKNEEQMLGNSLSSISGISDELIIVDTGSVDNTKAIASQYNAKIYDFKWNDDFSAARNYSLEKATGDWILVLDADESISECDHEHLLKLINSNDSDAYILDQRTYGNNLKNSFYVSKSNDNYKESQSYNGWILSKLVRLFKNDHTYHYRYKIHEVIEPSIEECSGVIKEAGIPIHHFTYSKDDNFLNEKIQRYLDIGLKQIKDTPNNPKPYLEVALVYFQRKDYKNAEDLLLKSISIDPGYPELHDTLGTIYLETNRILEAEKVLRDGLSINGNNIKMLNKMASVCFSKKDFSSAKDFLEQALLMDANSLMTYNNLGLLYALSNEPQKAIDYFSKSLSISPDNLYALTTQGMLYVNLGKHVEARNILDRALKEDANDVRVLYHLAISCGALGQKGKAKNLLLRAKNISPDDPAILSSLKQLE